MGRRLKPKIDGIRDWVPRILDVPEKIIALAHMVSAVKDKLFGHVLRDYIIAGVKAEAKKLKIKIPTGSLRETEKKQKS